MSEGLRIAMWSGPRNISTAMMRSWENRADCVVSDEPLYAHYLAATGADHPVREAVMAAGETDWRRVVADLNGPIPGGRPLWYQKHMCHHLLPDMDREWIHQLTNVLLIREPAEVIASYLRARSAVSADEIGLPQQVQLFNDLCQRLGRPPIVIDAGEFLRAPEAHLRALCLRLDIDFDPAMLRWPAGPRDSDGVWAPHWYQAVWRSTGFVAPSDKPQRAVDSTNAVLDACRPLYKKLLAHRLVISG